MAYVVMAYVVMACIVIVLYSYGLCSYDRQDAAFRRPAQACVRVYSYGPV